MNEQNATESYTVNGQFDVNFTSMKNNYNKQNIWKRQNYVNSKKFSG